MNYKNLRSIFTIALTSTLLVSCGGEEPEQKVIDKEVLDPNSDLNTVFDGKIFSIPSPVQTAILIKGLNLEFDNSLINDNDNLDRYITETQQALNLGIFGCDLGYASIYNQKKEALSYMNTIESLSNKLGINAAFDAEFIKRFEKNSGNEDSMIIIMSDGFKKTDNYLKNNNRKPTSALILTGGWIESVYIACSLNKKSNDTIIRRRIGEQKQSLNSIVDLLTEYNKAGSNDEILVGLNELKALFDKVEFNYTYSAPETDKDEKLTTFHHELDVQFSDKVMDEIEAKIIEIRSDIIK